MTHWISRPLTTDRLWLRPLHPDDADAYLDMFRDPHTMVFWSGAAITSLAEAQKMLKADLEWTASGDALCWAIALPDSGKLIGKISLYLYSEQNRRAETGYILNRRHWGRGLMTEALGAVLDFAFDELMLHRIEADVDPKNSASLALLSKFGFVREGRFRDRWFVHDEWHDSVMLGLLRHEYSRNEIAK